MFLLYFFISCFLTIKQKFLECENDLQVHRLVVTDDEEKVTGIISLSDLLYYLVLRPCGEF